VKLPDAAILRKGCKERTTACVRRWRLEDILQTWHRLVQVDHSRAAAMNGRLDMLHDNTNGIPSHIRKSTRKRADTAKHAKSKPTGRIADPHDKSNALDRQDKHFDSSSKPRSPAFSTWPSESSSAPAIPNKRHVLQPERERANPADPQEGYLHPSIESHTYLKRAPGASERLEQLFVKRTKPSH
jgi:hypothetical protein